MAAAPTSPHTDSVQHDLLAHAYLNDPNFDVDAELRRRSSGSHRRRAAQSTALDTRPSIRRRPSVVPSPPPSPLQPAPSESPPRSGFPLIPQCLPTTPSLSRQPSYEPQLHPVQNFAANSQPAPWNPSVSLSMSPFISNHSHSTAVEDEYYDMDSVAPSTSPRHLSTETHQYDKKQGSNDDYAMEMDTRSEMDFEEYVFLFSTTTTVKQSPTLLGLVGLSFPLSHLSVCQVNTTDSRLICSDIEDDSPYPEVRAAVANTDDPSMPTNTFRMCVSPSRSISQSNFLVSHTQVVLGNDIHRSSLRSQSIFLYAVS